MFEEEIPLSQHDQLAMAIAQGKSIAEWEFRGQPGTPYLIPSLGLGSARRPFGISCESWLGSGLLPSENSSFLRPSPETPRRREVRFAREHAGV